MRRFTKTNFTGLQQSVADRPQNWEALQDPLTYAYSGKPHSSTSLAPNELVLTRPPLILAFEARPTVMCTHSLRRKNLQNRNRPAALKNTANEQVHCVLLALLFQSYKYTLVIVVTPPVRTALLLEREVWAAPLTAPTIWQYPPTT